MQKTIPIKCPCGRILNYVHQPDSWPKDKISRGNTICPACKKKVRYEIVGGRCHASYM